MKQLPFFLLLTLLTLVSLHLIWQSRLIQIAGINNNHDVNNNVKNVDWNTLHLVSTTTTTTRQQQQQQQLDDKRLHNNAFTVTPPSNHPTLQNHTQPPHPPKHRRPVLQFLTCESMQRRNDTYTGRLGGCFSGMWWATRALAEQLHPPLIIYASSSYNAFTTAGPHNVVLPQDWLDLSVEHVSAYIKMVPQTDRANQILTSILHNYTERLVLNTTTNPVFPTTDVINSTLAMLPIYVNEEEQQSHTNATASTIMSSTTMSSTLDMYSLAATIASLWRLGIPRVVIAGNTRQEPSMVQQVRALLLSLFVPSTTTTAAATTKMMEISYVQYPVKRNKYGMILGPVLAVRQMKLALTGKLLQNITNNNNNTNATEEQQKWLGDNATRWKYIYFSEPDLPLYTRPQALAALGEQLKRNKVLAAHRLQPIAHAVDFGSLKEEEDFAQDLVPNNDGNKMLGEMQDLTFADGCCDAGNYWPGAEGRQSPQFWYEIGFLPYEKRKNTKLKNDPAAIKNRNKRLMSYPMIRLKEGLRVPVVSQHARVCIPIHGGYCGKVPQLQKTLR